METIQRPNNLNQVRNPPYRPMGQPPQGFFGGNHDPRLLKRKELRDVVSYHKQNINVSRDLKIIPPDVSILSLDVDEQIFIYMRRHWTENITWIVRNIFYSIIPILIFPILNILSIEKIEFISFREVFIIMALYYSVITTNVVKDFFDWYFDPYIITSERIIHYEFKPFSKYVVQETMLQSVQKIEEKAAGILSNIFGYGSLLITIEGPNEQIVFKNIPQQTRVRNMISDLVRIAKKYESS